MKIHYLFLSFIIVLLSFNISDARWITICSNSHNHKEFTHKHNYHKKHNRKHKIIKRKNRKHFIKREFPVNIPSMVSSDIQHPLKNLIVNNSTTIYNEPFVYIDIFVDINRPVFFGLYGNGGYSDKVLSEYIPKYNYGLKEKDKEPNTYLEKYKLYHNSNFDYDIIYGRNNKEILNSWDHILSSVLSYSSDNGFSKQFNEKELVCKSIWIPEPPNYPPVPEPSSILLFISGLFIFFTYRKKFVDKV